MSDKAITTQPLPSAPLMNNNPTDINEIQPVFNMAVPQNVADGSFSNIPMVQVNPLTEEEIQRLEEAKRNRRNVNLVDEDIGYCCFCCFDSWLHNSHHHGGCGDCCSGCCDDCCTGCCDDCCTGGGDVGGDGCCTGGGDVGGDGCCTSGGDVGGDDCCTGGGDVGGGVDVDGCDCDGCF